ncbi:MAG TPA: terminase family protein [Candidatus Gastranaerophilales bacterium]|nr:terminase family protein [Candidatus Gastranaerophilales bacterium]
MNPNKENELKTPASQHFFPYQLRWLNDNSRIKIWEKSRRIGATYVQSYEDVRDCVVNAVENVWFSSADESAAREYINYCEKWAKLYDIAATSLGEVIINSEEDIKAFVIEFANGARINALSSNPKAFRSKGGKVVLDEFAHHNNAEDLWAAAKPCTTWKYPIRILSTHNGQNCMFYKFIEQVKKEMNPADDTPAKLNWSLHTTPIQLAVDEGLVSKILGKSATEKEKQQWLDEQRAGCFNEFTWLQEYCCVAIDEATAFLPYQLIVSCELENLYKELEALTGDIYVGMDIGRKKDLTVIWVLEKLGRVNYTRMLRVLENTEFRIQEEILYNILKHKNLRRCCIDSTGIGMHLAESAQKKFGQYRAEAVTFTNKVKEELAYGLRTHFEDKTVYIPAEYEIREDLHSVRRTTTAAGNIRFDVEKSDASGHADRFWALALALHSAENNYEPIHIETRCRRETEDMTKGLCDNIDFDLY